METYKEEAERGQKEGKIENRRIQKGGVKDDGRRYNHQACGEGRKEERREGGI